MTRVLFTTRHLRVGGAQRNWTMLLPGLADRGFEPRLITLEFEGEMFEALRAGGIAVATAGMRSRLDLPAARRALWPGDWTPDVVVSHDERSHLVSRVVARRASAPHVACDHGGPGFRLKPHRELVLRALAPGFAATVTMSARRVPDLRRRRFPAERIHVIANGIDPAALRRSRSRRAVRAALGLSGDDFVALLPAVLRPEKRADRFVHALERAHVTDPRVRGLVAGYGPEGDRVRRLAASGQAVAVLGHRSDVADLIAASDVVCLTSEVEGGPYAALEAMALGKPVVAMRAGALDELVVDGHTGVLVAQGDEDGLARALVALARNRRRAAALGAAGQELQRASFTAAAMSDAYAGLLRALAAARSRTSARVAAATSAE